jgi:hypothetical protein
VRDEICSADCRAGKRKTHGRPQQPSGDDDRAARAYRIADRYRRWGDHEQLVGTTPRDPAARVENAQASAA